MRTHYNVHKVHAKRQILTFYSSGFFSECKQRVPNGIHKQQKYFLTELMISLWKPWLQPMADCKQDCRKQCMFSWTTKKSTWFNVCGEIFPYSDNKENYTDHFCCGWVIPYLLLMDGLYLILLSFLVPFQLQHTSFSSDSSSETQLKFFRFALLPSPMNSFFH